MEASGQPHATAALRVIPVQYVVVFDPHLYGSFGQDKNLLFLPRSELLVT
jgi:hypothetical protein